MIKMIRGFFRDVKYGIMAFWHFRKVIWRWRGWDWEYTHAITIRGVEGMRDCIRDYGNHEDSDKDVAQMEHAIQLYQEFRDEIHHMEQEVLWERHWKALTPIRNWWD